MIAIEKSEQLLLAGQGGILKATKNHAIKYYFSEKPAVSICHITESIYLVALWDDEFLIAWNEKTDQKLFQICQD